MFNKLPISLVTVVLLCTLLSIFFLSLSSTPTYAYVPQGKAEIKVGAEVGEFFLSVSGFISPYASVGLLIDGIYYRGTVAGADGKFSISQVRVNRGLTSFCLQAKDYHNLGESYSCFTFPPLIASMRKDNIFLPPTIALQRSEIAAGSSVLAFGYSMPGAKVTVHVAGRSITVTADSEGYYEVTIADLPAGTYQLYADATYNGQPSVAPSRFLTLKALGLWEQFLRLLQRLWEVIVGFFIGSGLGLLWVGIPLIILIIILIVKLWPQHFTFIYSSRLFSALFGSPKKKLHHAYFVGY